MVGMAASPAAGAKGAGGEMLSSARGETAQGRKGKYTVEGESGGVSAKEALRCVLALELQKERRNRDIFQAPTEASVRDAGK